MNLNEKRRNDRTVGILGENKMKVCGIYFLQGTV